MPEQPGSTHPMPSKNNNKLSRKFHLPRLHLGKSSRAYSMRQLAAFALVFGLIGLYFLWRALAASPVLTVQAEAMSLPAGATVINDSSASATKAVRLSADGSLNATISLPSSAASVTVSARAETCQGSPNLSAALDGKSLLASTAVSSSGYTAYSASGSFASGSHSLSLSGSNLGVVTAGKSGKVKCSRVLYVDVTTFYAPDATPPAAITAFSANPTTVSSGTSTTLSWNSSNASSCSASGAWSGAKATSGSETSAALSANATFSLTCTGPGGSDTKSLTVTVSSTPPPSSGDKLTWSPPGFSNVAGAGAYPTPQQNPANYPGFTVVKINNTGNACPSGYTAGSYPNNQYWVCHLSNNADYVLQLDSRQMPAGTRPSIVLNGGRNVVIIGGRIHAPMQADADTYSDGWASGRGYNDAGIEFRGQTGTVHMEGVEFTGFMLRPILLRSNTTIQNPFNGQFYPATSARFQLQNIRCICALMWKEGGQHSHSDSPLMVQDPMDQSQGLYIDKLTANVDNSGFALYMANNKWLPRAYFKRVNLHTRTLWGTGAGQCADPGNGRHYHTVVMWHGIPTHLTVEDFWYTTGFGRVSYSTDCPAMENYQRTLQNAWAQQDSSGGYSSATVVQTGDGHTQGNTMTFTNPTKDNVWGPNGSNGVVTWGVPSSGDFVPAGSVGTSYVSPGYQ